MTIKPPQKLPDNPTPHDCLSIVNKHNSGQLALAMMWCWLSLMVLSQTTFSNSEYIELQTNDLWLQSQPTTSKLDYDPELAEFALDFAAASYATDPTACLSKHNATLIKRVTMPCDILSDECWAYIAQSEEWIIMAIRGTEEKKQLYVELLESMLTPKVAFPTGGYVLHYFHSAFEVLWKDAGFGDILQKLKTENPNAKILFTGHSFGGAIASLSSALFVHENPLKGVSDSVFSITFGQPRVGNYDYAVAHDNIVPNSWRLVHKMDIVPHLPPCWSWFGHCTFGLNLATYHHGTEIWYPESDSRTHQICSGLPLNEDSHCSNQFSRGFTIDDHEYYLGKDVSHHGNTKCGL